MSRRSAVRARLSAIRFFGSSHSLVGPGQLTLNQQTSVRIRVGTKKKQVGAVEACRAHNPKVPRSKLGLANLDFFHSPVSSVGFRAHGF
jgi:hypothetical protein